MAIQLPTLSPQTAERLLHGAVVSHHHNWAVLKASGPTLRDYLQGQITQDINKLTADCGIHSCILSAQSKAISELYILQAHGNELIILTPKNYAEATVARLRQFALGHQVRIGIVDTLAVCSIQGSHAASVLEDFGLSEPQPTWLSCYRKPGEDCFAMVMPEKPQGFWVISSTATINTVIARHPQAQAGELEAMRIIRGLPDFGAEWDASLHPLNANLVEFNGVDFNKGCYVGQEVVSRMHWRGGIKKKLYRVAINGVIDSLPCPIVSTAKIGELKTAAIDHENNSFGIALLPIETAASNTPLKLENGTDITILEACHA